MNEIWNSLTQTDLGALGLETVLLVLLLAFCIGHVVAWTYMFTHTGLSYSRVFTTSLVVLPVLTAMTLLLMFNNIVLAIGLFAVIAVVRFRNVLKDTRDTAFILWAIVQGMACGTQRFGVAVLMAVAVSLIFFYMQLTSFGGRHRYDVVLSLQCTSGPEPIAAVKQVLRRHAVRAQLASQRDVDSQNVDVSYRLLLRDPSRGGELLRELEGAPGIGRVALYHREDDSEV
jgi:hypothetical protein